MYVSANNVSTPISSVTQFAYYTESFINCDSYLVLFNPSSTILLGFCQRFCWHLCRLLTISIPKIDYFHFRPKQAYCAILISTGTPQRACRLSPLLCPVLFGVVRLPKTIKLCRPACTPAIPMGSDASAYKPQRERVVSECMSPENGENKDDTNKTTINKACSCVREVSTRCPM